MTTPNPKPRRRPRSKISKMLTDRIKGTRALASSIKKWKGRVAEGVVSARPVDIFLAFDVESLVGSKRFAID